jgi:glycosyltransferase involved in cell wall biosynthesis
MGAGLAIACFGRESNRGYLGGGAAYAEDVSGEKLAEAIGRLIEDAEFRKRSGEGNRRRAGDFNWSRAGAELQRIYEKLKI